MKQRLSVLFLCLVFVLVGQAQSKSVKSPAELPRPKLVVGIVIDQMRWDYLYRYYDRYGTNGFRRMLSEGFSCENTYINYIPTVTAVGHASIYTGSVPAIHGIAANDFIINATGQRMYCTDDSMVQTVGSTSDAGKMSPRNLKASTITDELRLATNFRSKVIGVALKDRGSILPAGHSANAAYWFDSKTGNFITSTYYLKELPEWVQKFNGQKLAEKYLKQNWAPLYASGTYVQSTPDNNPYEGPFSGMETPTLPVKTSEMYGKSFDLIRTTPYGNTLTLEMAKAAVENEQLGQNGGTDFLAVSCSSTDYIGHRFGVNAVEIEDTYLRLDRDLGDFFAYLDKKIGKGAYTVFLSADHGAAHNPNFLTDNRIAAGLWSGGKVQRELNRLLEVRYGEKDLVTSFGYSQVHLNHPLIKSKKLDEAAIRADCVDFLGEQPEVVFAADLKNIGDAAVPAELKERMVNGYHKDRSGVITFVLQPGWYPGSPKATGTSHGAWNAYDARIPLLWMGWGISKGATARPVNMTDIAPTLAALLHIQEPNGNIGKPITEVIKSNTR